MLFRRSSGHLLLGWRCFRPRSLPLLLLNFGGKPIEIMLSKWAVSSGGSTVHAIGAAASRAGGSITLLRGSHLCELGLLGNKWAVSSGGSPVHAIRAAVPANIGAAASRAGGSITLLRGSHLCELGLLGNKWAVSSRGSTVHAIRAAVPAIFVSWVFLATNGQSAAVA